MGGSLFCRMKGHILVAVLLIAHCTNAHLLFSVSETENNEVIYSIANKGETDVSILTYGTPFEDSIMFPVLRIHSGIEKIEAKYIGPVARRVTPAPKEAFITIAANSEIQTPIKIEQFYSISKDHWYEITAIIPDFDASFVGASHTKSLRKFLNKTIPFEKFKTPDTQYQNCDLTEKGQIDGAVPVATTQSKNAKNCMSADRCDSLTDKWFGSTSKTNIVNYNYDLSVFIGVSSNLTANGINAYCNPTGCGPFVYAYVYPNDPTMTVYLCGAFWSQPDERANTLVHEMSHFTVLGGTQDYAYGQPDCLNLAKTDPTKASHNADNVCYFSAEA